MSYLRRVVGFGPPLVQSLAADVYMTRMDITEDQLDWMPSKRWAYWFIEHPEPTRSDHRPE